MRSEFMLKVLLVAFIAVLFSLFYIVSPGLNTPVYRVHTHRDEGVNSNEIEDLFTYLQKACSHDGHSLRKCTRFFPQVMTNIMNATDAQNTYFSNNWTGKNHSGELRYGNGNNSVASDFNQTCKTQTECKKNIVYFGLRPHWKVNSYYSKLLNFPRAVMCPEESCQIYVDYTTNVTNITANADVLIFTNIFEWITDDDWIKLMQNKTQCQKWVMVTQESPIYVPGLMPPAPTTDLEFFYDFTDTYRRDATIRRPYGEYSAYSEPQNVLQPSPEEAVRGKEKFAIWVASHCETLQWDRTRFVDELGKLFPIDRFGKCGNQKFAWDSPTSDEKKLYGNYKFVLSLENSCCEDYITEKFWRSFQMGVVPVVVGAPYESYTAVAPPYSFIHADEFGSLGELAGYLHRVAKNDTKYAEYFGWRALGMVSVDSIQQHFSNPLLDKTVCQIAGKVKDTENSIQSKKWNPYGTEWISSCKDCGKQTWLKDFQYPKDHKRHSESIWV